MRSAGIKKACLELPAAESVGMCVIYLILKDGRFKRHLLAAFQERATTLFWYKMQCKAQNQTASTEKLELVRRMQHFHNVMVK